MAMRPRESFHSWPGNERRVRKITSCSTNAWTNFPITANAHLPNIFESRKENADALADLAIGNFIEMRDKTASRTFRAKRNSIICSMPRCLVCICHFTPWSLLPVSHTRQAAWRVAREIESFTRAHLFSVLVGILALAALPGRVSAAMNQFNSPVCRRRFLTLCRSAACLEPTR